MYAGGTIWSEIFKLTGGIVLQGKAAELVNSDHVRRAYLGQ
jgi:ABC-type lipopolysaccharide export system ATPase subunit